MSPLREQHLQAEATLMPYGPPALPVELVETFGEADFEYAAIRKACALVDSPHRGTIEVVGQDRIAFLNNMVTQSLEGLEPLRARRALWLNRKGRVVGDLVLAELGGRMLIDCDVHAVEAVVESLSSYVIADDVELRDVTDRVHRLSLHGPTGPELLEAVAEASPDGPSPGELREGGACVCRIAGAEVVVVRQDLTGETGFELAVPVGDALGVWRTLVERGSPINGEAPGSLPARVKLRPAGWAVVNTARIEAGRPLMFADFGPESLPAELGEATLHDRVSFTKGCYLGQEVVARMHSLGKPKQVLVALRPGGDPPRDERGLCVQPLGGANVALASDPDNPMGVVTSSTISPMLGGVPIMFAVLKSAAADEGVEVEVPAEGRVVRCRVSKDLGFYQPG